MHGLIIANDLFEDIELILTRDVLIRAGIRVSIASLNDTLRLKSKCGLFIEANLLFKDTNFKNYDFLIIPGGNWAVTYDNKHHHYNDFVEVIKKFYNAKRLVAAICAGPRILSFAGIIKENEYTAYPGVSEAINIKTDKKVVYVKDNLITADGPGSAYHFSFEIVKYLKGNDALEKVKEDLNIK